MPASSVQLTSDGFPIHFRLVGPTNLLLPSSGTLIGTGSTTTGDLTIAGTITGTALVATGGGIQSQGSTALLGYGAGATTSVTQGTSKSATVAGNAPTVVITTHDATLNDATNVSFQLTNTLIADTDQVIVNHVSGGTLGVYVVQAHSIVSGSCKISIRNVSGGGLGEALVLSATVIRGGTI